MRKIYDVCIVGAGTAGMGAAYALTQLTDGMRFSVALVEQYPSLGGTAVNGWVQTWIEGLIPPYLYSIFKIFFKEETIEKSILPDGKGTGNLFVPHDKLADIYMNDMTGRSTLKNNGKGIDLYLCHKFSGITEKSIDPMDHRVIISSIKIVGESDEPTEITARYFIDSSGDGSLCRAAGASWFIGEDSYHRFGESLMKEVKNNNNNLNAASLFYKVLPPNKSQDDSDQLREITSVGYNATGIFKPDYIDSDGYANQSFCNPLNGMGLDARFCTEKPIEAYKAATSRILEHWKYVKLSIKDYSVKNSEAKAYRGYAIEQKNWNYANSYAPMLGIRESYRIECEYMLRQDDLTEEIKADDLRSFIACGSHIVDIHGPSSICRKEISAFRSNINPSGIPYECLIPKGLKNVLIACKAYGASHIALSARRVNKDMAQLGWAAGFAVIECLEKEKNDVRCIDVGNVQKKSGFADNVRKLCKMLNDRKKKEQ